MKESCEGCISGTYNLGKHHITPRSQYGKMRRQERDEASNFITLCQTCHDDIHSKRKFLLINKYTKVVRLVSREFLQRWSALKGLKRNHYQVFNVKE